MFKKAASLAVILVFVLVTFSTAGELWASRKSNKYHYPDCRWAQRILPQNLIVFNSPEAAIRAGYIPCKICRPPISSYSGVEIDSRIKFAQLVRTIAYAARICKDHT